MCAHFSDSSNLQPKKTLNESDLNPERAKKTVVEPNSNKPSRTPARIDPLEGLTIGDSNRYRLQFLLGQGGMSKVYQAKDTKFEERVVAIKLMTNYSPASSQRSLKRFMAEVNAISRLKHPNIIQILDFGVTPDEAPFYGLPFYVMEYFAGQTLQNLLSKTKSLPQDSILNIISQVCAGLKQAHQKGIAHRDLKPDNIFLVADGGLGEIVKILDFGIAKNISAETDNQTQLTQQGSFIGTYRYASPEQCRGLVSIDQRTDIYSLGIILYETISGYNPYNLSGDFITSQADWIASHIKVSPKPLKQQPGCENLDDELESIVMKCLAKSPQDRFSNLEELEDALANNLVFRIEEISNPQDPKFSDDRKKDSSGLATEVEAKQDSRKKIFIKNVNDSLNFSPVLNSILTNSLSGERKFAPVFLACAVLLIGLLGTGGYFIFSQDNDNNSDSIAVSSDKIPSDNLATNNYKKSIDRSDLNLIANNLETQYQQQNYQDCYQLALDNADGSNSVIQQWLGKCGLEAAKIQADAHSYTNAIAIARDIPDTVYNYQEVQNNINTWSQNILDYATTVYEKGRLEQAIEITQAVPKNASIKATIPDLISQWQQQEENHKAIVEQAQYFLGTGQWYDAKREAEKIPNNFVFWRTKAQSILDRANQQINAIAAEQRRREQARPLKDRLKNVPLLPDDYVERRLRRR